MDKDEAAKALGATVRTVNNWIRRGMPDPVTRGIGKAKAWKKLHVNPSPKKGGKIAGAGRKPRAEVGSWQAEEEREKQPELEYLNRDERLTLMQAGKATRAQIDLTLEETKALDAVRENEEANGKLLEAADTEAAWGELLQAHKGDCDGLPQRLEAKAGARLRLSPEQGRELRGIAEEEVLELFKRLLGGEWRK